MGNVVKLSALGSLQVLIGGVDWGADVLTQSRGARTGISKNPAFSLNLICFIMN